MKERSQNDSSYRYGFNGKENDRDFGNKQVIQDYGFRLYNPAIGKFLSVDPLASNFPNQSDYISFDDDPINKIDPDGRTGVAVKDKSTKTITIQSTIYFYGNSATKELAKMATDKIDAGWNAANATMLIDGEVYDVKFETTPILVSVDEAMVLAENNKNIQNNFVRIETQKDSGQDFSFTIGGVSLSRDDEGGWGGNAGFFLVRDIEGDNQSIVHEWGHFLGWFDVDQAYSRGTQLGAHDLIGNKVQITEYEKIIQVNEPGLMTPIDTPVDVATKKFHKSTLLPDGTIDGSKRHVIQRDVDLITIDKERLESKKKVDVGREKKLSNRIFDEKAKEIKN